MTFSWLQFWQYWQWSLEFLFVWPMWLVTVLLVANLGVALLKTWSFRSHELRYNYVLPLLNLLFIPMTLAIGVLGHIDPSEIRGSPNEAAVWANNGLPFVFLVVSIYWIYQMKGLRWFAVAVVLLQLWMLMGAGLITGMSISGVWL